MKTIVTFLCLVFFLNTSQAQKVISLDPAKFDPAPLNFSYPEVLVNSNVKDLSLEVKEEYMNEFMENPIRFIESKFDFNSMNLKDFSGAEVKFVNSKGYLQATYNNKGNLVKTFQRFKDLLLPRNIFNKVFLENPNYIVIGSSYTAKGKLNRIDKEVYRLKLKAVDGKNIRRLKVSHNKDLDEIVINYKKNK